MWQLRLRRPSAGDETTTTAGGGKAVSITGVPGVTDDAIKYAVIGTKANNPLGTCILDCYLTGIKAYFDYRNSEGGIHGRKLEISKVLDDELSKNQVRALEVTTSNDSFGDFNATLLASGWADLDKAHLHERRHSLRELHRPDRGLRRQVGGRQEAGLARLRHQRELQGVRRGHGQVDRDVQQRDRGGGRLPQR
jgi:hypothetical protein